MRGLRHNTARLEILRALALELEGFKVRRRRARASARRPSLRTLVRHPRRRRRVEHGLLAVRLLHHVRPARRDGRVPDVLRFASARESRCSLSLSSSPAAEDEAGEQGK